MFFPSDQTLLPMISAKPDHALLNQLLPIFEKRTLVLTLGINFADMLLISFTNSSSPSLSETIPPFAVIAVPIAVLAFCNLVRFSAIVCGIYSTPSRTVFMLPIVDCRSEISLAFTAI